MGFWPFFGRGKLSKKSKIPLSEGHQARMTATAGGAGRESIHNQSHTAGWINGRQPTMGSTAGNNAFIRDKSPRPQDRSDRVVLDRVVGRDQANKGNLTSISSPAQVNSADHRPAILHPRPGGKEPSVLRRKSSKRRPEAQSRGEEVGLPTSPIPIPKRSISYSGGLSRRESKRPRSRLTKNAEPQNSDMSLPIPESLSDMGQISSQQTFTIKVLDVLSPRPTIKYSSNPRHTFFPSTDTARNLAQHRIEKEKEADSSSKRRIADLANDLDAQALRELMERDQRRRERKRKGEQVELEQKLQQRARYQDEQEARSPSRRPYQDGRGVPSLARSSSPLRPISHNQVTSRQHEPITDDRHPTKKQSLTSSNLGAGTSLHTRPSHTSFSRPSSAIQPPSDLASTPSVPETPREVTKAAADQAQPDRGASKQNSAQLGAWTSIFKRVGSRRQSSQIEWDRPHLREAASFSRNSLPPPRRSPQTSQTSVVGPSRQFRRSAIPHRTHSRFIEDLPEFPLTPPDSRVESPEAAPASDELAKPTRDLSRETPPTSEGGAVSERGHQADPVDPPPSHESTNPLVAALSRSLASVDSEASWLSGKPAKRSSTHRDSHRQSQSSMQAPLPEPDGEEEFNLANDPYFSRLSPGVEERRKSSTKSALRRASSTVLNLDADSFLENEASVSLSSSSRAKVGDGGQSGVGRPPPTASRLESGTKSRHTVLPGREAQSGAAAKAWLDDESPNAEDSEWQTSAPSVMHAQSVNYGSGHARRISAGSARLLEIRSSSVDSKRLSIPRVQRYSLPGQGLATKEE